MNVKYFNYEHLPERLQAYSKPFHNLMVQIEQMDLKDDVEKMEGLRKLLEAKDCIVRASI